MSASKLGRYAVLRHRRGDDPRVQGLSLRASGLLVRLMLNRRCTSFGAIPGGRAALAEECGADPKEFSEAFTELESSGLVVADWTARLVFIEFMVEDDPPSNASVATGRGRMLGDLPECDLRRRIAATCFRHAGAFGDEFTEAAANFGGLDVDELEVEDGIPRPIGRRP